MIILLLVCVLAHIAIGLLLAGAVDCDHEMLVPFVLVWPILAIVMCGWLLMEIGHWLRDRCGGE